MDSSPLASNDPTRFSITALLLLGLASCGDSEAAPQGKKGGAMPPPKVVVAEVEQATVPIVREFVARTQAVETVDVQARVEALLNSRKFDEGFLVKKDQVLYELDDRTYVASLAAAEAQVEQAKANLKLAEEQVTVRAAEASLVEAKATLKKAEQDVARLRPLAEKDAVPRQDLDTALAAEEVAQAQVSAREASLTNAKIEEEVGILYSRAKLQSAEAELDLAELDLSYCTIRSPLEGLIGRTQVNVGNLVGRGESTVLATISSIDPIYVTFSISEAEYLKFADRYRDKNAAKPTQPLQLVLADDSIFDQGGEVVTTDRAVDEATGTLQVVAKFPNPTHNIRPGQFGRLRAVVAEVENALLVPQRAVMEQQSTKVVFVVGEDNKVALRTIQITERHEGKYVVKEGLQAGDRVIVEGQLKARPGSVVEPTDAPVSSEPGEGK